MEILLWALGSLITIWGLSFSARAYFKNKTIVINEDSIVKAKQISVLCSELSSVNESYDQIKILNNKIKEIRDLNSTPMNNKEMSDITNNIFKARAEAAALNKEVESAYVLAKPMLLKIEQEKEKARIEQDRIDTIARKKKQTEETARKKKRDEASAAAALLVASAYSSSSSSSDSGSSYSGGGGDSSGGGSSGDF